MPADGIVTPPSTILVVDDSRHEPAGAGPHAATARGHRILAAKDGPTALDIARRTQPDLMLLDVMMPGMDGFEVCRELKAQPETRDTLVIFLSARGEVADKVSGLELGAIDYITKPIQGEEVLARVAAHLSRQHLERELRAEPRSPRQGARRRGADAAAAAAADDAAACVDQFRQLLPDQPPCRRRLLRRAAARRRSLRHPRRRRVRPRRARGDRDGDDPRGGAHLSRRRRRSAARCCTTSTGISSFSGTRRCMRRRSTRWSMPRARTIRMSSAGHPLPLKAHCGDGASRRVARYDDVPAVERAERRAVRRSAARRPAIDGCSSPTASPTGRRRTGRCSTWSAWLPALAQILRKDSGRHRRRHRRRARRVFRRQEPEDDQTLLVVGFD